MNANSIFMIQMSVVELEQMLRKAVDDALDVKLEPLRRQFEDRIIGVQEVCKTLGVTRMTLYNLEKRGELFPIRIGSKVKYKESAVMAYLAEKETKY